MNLSAQQKTGLLVIVGVALLVLGIQYLKGFGFFEIRNEYVVYYDSVDGLAEASPLYLNGYKIGQVSGTQMVHDGTRHRIKVKYHISEKELVIPDDSRIEIYSADLFTKAARLSLGKSAAMASVGDTLLGNTQLSMTEVFSQELDPIKQRAEALMASVDTVLASFQRIMDEGTENNISNSFSNIRASLEAFQRTAERLDLLIQKESPMLEKSINNFTTLSDTLIAHSNDLGDVMTNVSMITDTLARGGLGDMMRTINETSTRLRNVMRKMDEGTGSLGKLANDDSLYVNLNNASQELDLLLEDMRINPNRYVQVSVFGKKEKKPALSDKDVKNLKERMKELD